MKPADEATVRCPVCKCQMPARDGRTDIVPNHLYPPIGSMTCPGSGIMAKYEPQKNDEEAPN